MLKSEDKKKPTEKVKTVHSHRNMPMLKNSEATTPADKREYKETILLFIKMLVTIFLCEATIMVLMYIIPLSRDWEIIADPLLLTALATLILYWLFVRPIWLALKQRNRAVESLRKSEDQLSTFMASATDGFVLFDSELNHIEMNESALEITGLERKDVIGKNLLDVVPSLKETGRYDEYKKVIKTGVPFIVSDFVPHAKFGNKHIELKAFKVGDGLGMIFSDITKHKKLGEELQKSEERYRNIVQDQTEFIVRWQTDGIRTFVNDSYCQYFGKSREELIGSSFFPLISEEDLERVRKRLGSLNPENPISSDEHRVIRQDGSIGWNYWTDRAIFDESGKLIEFQSVGQDITERKMAEDELKKSELKFRLVTETIEDVFWMSTPGIQKMIYVSPAYEKIWRRSCKDLYKEPMSFVEAIHPEDRDRLCSTIMEYHAHGKAYSCEYRIIPCDDQLRWISERGFPVFDDKGKLLCMTGVCIDITEHKKAEEALLIKQNETEALLSATRSIPEKKTFSEAARGILVAAKGLLGADSGYVALLSEDSRQNEVLFLDAGNRQCTVDPNLPMPIRGLRAEAYGKVAVLWENDFPLSKWEEFLPDGHVKLDNVLFASIMIDGKAVGTIGLANKPGGFGEHDAEMAKAFSDIAAVGLRFARDQEKLSQSEEKFRKLTETIDDVFWITSLGEFEKIEYVSDAFRKIWGRKPEELYNDSRLWTEAIHPDDRRGIVQSFEGLIRGDNDYDVEYRILRDDGSIRWIWDRGFRTFDNVNQVIRIMGLAQDITESKKVEKALRKSENLYRTLVEANPYGIQEIDTSGIITYTNPAYQKKLGYTEQELLGKSILDLLESESKRDKLKDYLSVLAKEQPQPTTYYQNNRTKDNRIIDMAIDWNYKRDNEGRVIGFTSVITDITDRKKAEQQILENQAQLKSLASQLSITEERERRRIATELHDQIGQSLVFSKIKLDELHQSASSSELTKALDEICNNIGQIIQDTRSLTFDLSSPILNEFGLEAAVADWLEVQIGAKHGIETEFEDDGRQKPLDDDIQALLFRNVRELLINIVKHANAKKVKVSIQRVNEHIHIDVEDDGKGFNTVKVTSRATGNTQFGLFSIKERLEQLGGHFEIDSEPGRGSKFTMTAPLKVT